MNCVKLSIVVIVALAVGTAAAAEKAGAKKSDAPTTVGDVLVPAGVVYKPAPDKANAAAREKLQRMFSFASPVEEITGLIGATPTIVGAPLWRKLVEQNPNLKEKLKTPQVKLMVPDLDDEGNIERMQQLDATMIRTSGEARLFWQDLEKMIRKSADPNTSPTVRKLTAQELSVYWSMIPFDIEEPIFMVEVGDHNILVNTPAKQESAIWIDDLKGVTMMAPEDDNASTAAKALSGLPSGFVDPTTGQEVVTGWTEYKPRTQKPKDENTSEGLASLDHVRLLTAPHIIEVNVEVSDVVKMKDWVDECLEKLAETLPEQHTLSVVIEFSAGANPDYRIAAKPPLPEGGEEDLRKILQQGPKLKSKSDDVEILFEFVVGE